MNRLKIVYHWLFIIVFLIHGIGLIAITFSLIKNYKNVNTVLHLLGCFFCLLWMFASAKLRVRIDLEHDSKKIKPLAGILIIFSSSGLTFLGLPVVQFSVITYLSSALMMGVFYRRWIAVIFTAFLSIASFVLLVLFHDVLAAAEVVVITVFIVPGIILFDRMIEDWKKQSSMYAQAQWAAYELTDVVMHLEESIHKAKIRTRIEESERVARDVHDTVGHSLTALLVQSTLVGKMIQKESARDKLKEMEGLIRSSLQELSAEVTSLRERKQELNDKDWYSRWRRLCETFSDCTGVQIRAEIADNLVFIDGSIGEAVYRIIQESLTNSYRHGRSTYVYIAIKYRKDLQKLLMMISDDGVGCEQFVPGNGIRGIRERIGALNGELIINTQPDKGFDLTIDIPLSVKENHEKAKVADSG